MDQHPPAASRPKKPPTPASWAPGRSGNPKGRPPKGSALTDAIRSKVDVAELVDIALDLARSSETESTKLSALNWLRDSGYTRPAERHEVGPPGSSDEDDLPDNLTLEELRELDRLDVRRAEILECAARRVPDPLGSDEDVALLPAGVARLGAK